MRSLNSIGGPNQRCRKLRNAAGQKLQKEHLGVSKSAAETDRESPFSQRRSLVEGEDAVKRTGSGLRGVAPREILCCYALKILKNTFESGLQPSFILKISFTPTSSCTQSFLT